MITLDESLKKKKSTLSLKVEAIVGAAMESSRKTTPLLPNPLEGALGLMDFVASVGPSLLWSSHYAFS